MKKILKYLPAVFCVAVPLSIAGVAMSIDYKVYELRNEIDQIETKVANEYVLTQEYQNHVQEETGKLNSALDIGVITQDYFNEQLNKFSSQPYILEQIENGQNVKLKDELSKTKPLENAMLKYDGSDVLSVVFPITFILGAAGFVAVAPWSKEQEEQWDLKEKQNNTTNSSQIAAYDASVTWGDNYGGKYKNEDELVADRFKAYGKPTYLASKKEERIK